MDGSTTFDSSILSIPPFNGPLTHSIESGPLNQSEPEPPNVDQSDSPEEAPGGGDAWW